MSIWSKIASMGIGEILEGAGEFAKDLRSALTGELTQEQRAQLQQRAQQLESQALQAKTRLTEVQAEIIKIEAQGGWLQRNWRPMLMLVVIAIIANNYVLVPYLSAIWPEYVHVLDLPSGLWALLNVGVGGYVAGRSGEKIIRDLKKGKK